ncbi:hypothetical protein ACHAXR_011525 [Thalassiosira sp. AJA248-18]
MKRASSLSSTIEQPDIEKFSNLIYASDDTVQLLRDELKSRLINAADDFKTMKAQEDAITQSGQDFDEKMNVDVDSKEKDRGYIFRLLSKIVRKISRSKKNYSDKKNPTQSSQGILTSGSFRQIKLEVGAAGEQVLSLAEQLSLLNPTPIPTLGFKHYGGVPPTDSKLAGSWKLRFTTAADASFSESEKRGVVTTSQMVDAEEGTLTNVVDFEKGKLKGFRVVVEGEPTSSTDIDLSFKAVKILRNSRFPRLFGQLSFRLPSRLIRWLASRNKIEEERGQGPSLRMRYLDDDLRMHTTDSGNWFIQTRLD